MGGWDGWDGGGVGGEKWRQLYLHNKFKKKKERKGKESARSNKAEILVGKKVLYMEKTIGRKNCKKSYIVEI